MIIKEQDIRELLGQMDPPKEAAFIKTPMSVADDVVAAFHDDSFERQGYPIHFKQAENCIRFRRGEVTVWTGENHTGKSEILNQFILSQSGVETSFIMSPEMPLYRTMQYMTQQATGSAKPSEQQIRKFLEYVENRIYLLDQQSTFKPQDVLNLIRYVHQTYKCYHVVIDSLMKCGINENDDHATIKWFVDQLCVTAKNLGIHVHLVAHAAKPRSAERPTRYSIKGSGSISDLPDNVIIMWRNESKERELDEGCDNQRWSELMAEPDARMIVDKQRHGSSWKGSLALWHDAPSRSFVESRMDKPKPIMNGRVA